MSEIFKQPIPGKPGKLPRPNWWVRLFGLTPTSDTSDARPRESQRSEQDPDRRKT